MIRTLVVEDDALTAEAHAAYLGRLDGFEVAGVVASLTEALAAIRAAPGGGPIDLVLLDMNLPDGRGIDLARRLRATGVAVDIIAITAVRDIEVVHTAISVGIVQYLIKPFSFATFAAKLGTYLDYRRRLEAASSSATQSDVDGMIASLRSPVDLPIPKGLAGATLEAVLEHVRSADRALSAAELAEPLHLSRVTARRYLEHLAEAGQVTRSPRYGTPGRPELEYRWAG
ncbi:response regulator [Lacisediminihabitans profunda]|uniref:Transcriptional regulatory protein n=1 Tax=Lacisediminihabitans profunda TaxID=2594790 RepID=A0A5C8UV71_9MICO|nr:response regulator [Lacisediminihabitans profunda]TXN31499.1 response regulator [Lacisediminihabitans profunda]